MGTRKTDGALEGHVDVKDAYRMAQVDVLTLVRLIAEVTSIHARCAKKAGLHFGHVGDLAELRRSLVAAVAQLAQQDEQFIWKRVAAMRRGKKA